MQYEIIGSHNQPPQLCPFSSLHGYRFHCYQQMNTSFSHEQDLVSSPKNDTKQTAVKLWPNNNNIITGTLVVCCFIVHTEHLRQVH